MTSKNAIRKCSVWLYDHECEIGEYEGKPFVIVPGWNVVNHKGFEAIVETVTGDSDNYGFYDEYTTCSNCGQVIRTEPDSYCWRPDFWVLDGEVLCKECTKESGEDYLEAMKEHGESVKSVNLDLVDPEDYDYVKVISGCEYGLHHDQNEDPRTIAKWAKNHDLDVVFTVSTGQFDAEWDAYMRAQDQDGDQGHRKLNEKELQDIREALIEHTMESVYGNRDFLRREFRQYPSPAELCEDQLREVSRIGANFASIGGEDGPIVYGSFEEMQEALK